MARNIELLNRSILGDNSGVLDARTFGSVTTSAISLPAYHSKYFETFPSVWAAAYAFTRLLRRDNASPVEASTAVGEWISLFALHYLGVAHLAEFAKREIIAECDPDFWPAVSGTYPRAGNTRIESLELLRLDESTVIGGYYPECIFFPARGRESW
ncbi:MAG TPA: hypothetical protein VF911_21795, partial [Thermoanaerobaculia bacterium]